MGRAPSHKKERVVVPKWGKEQDAFVRGKQYPGCRGTFPDCPPEIIEGVVAEACRSCPFFR